MIQIVFALLAGILTIGAPCILPLLPILLGASVGQHSRTRPLFIAAGFVIMFSLTGLTLSYVVQSFMLTPDTLRNVAVAALGVFALFMIWPKPFKLLTVRFGGAINAAGQLGQKSGSGNLGGFVLGLTLGLVWTPCAGPILGSILTLIATQGSSAKTTAMLIAYAAGAGIPMLIIAYGGQIISTKVRFLTQYSKRLQQIFGIIILLLAAAMYFQYDVSVQSKLIEYFPQSNLEKYLTDDELKTDPMEQQPAATKHKAVLGNYGQAPEFSGISAWLNSEPLTIQSLKGKVVLIDFWTYSCINCIRTLPYVTSWYEKYKDQGLVIVGVHTPEFEFEKVTDNVKTAIKRHKITYPVAQDNLFATWNNYSNRYWPAHYLIDKDGQVRYYHFGEGEYDKMEDAIIQLLEKPGMEEKLPNLSKETQKTGDVKTPEIYFGTSRLEYLTKSQKASLSENYTLPEKLEGNHFAMEGQWAFSTESAKLLKAGGKIKLKFYAGKIHMVAHSAEPVNLKITVDGKTQPDVLVSMSDLYTLFSSNDYAEHEIIIEIPESDFEAFTFTFG